MECINVLIHTEYKAMEQELTSVAKEADSAELFADEQKRFHELRASEQGEMAETANEAFKQAKALLEKLVKDKEGNNVIMVLL